MEFSFNNAVTDTSKVTYSWCFSGFNVETLLFLIYINDISDHLSSLVRLFANDLLLSSSSNNLLQIERKLNSDLNLLNT